MREVHPHHKNVWFHSLIPLLFGPPSSIQVFQTENFFQNCFSKWFNSWPFHPIVEGHFNPLKGSQNLHPKKVTAWITRHHSVGLPHEECHRIDRRQEHSIDLSIRESSLEQDDTGNGSGRIGTETSQGTWKIVYLPCEYFYTHIDAWMRWGYIFSCIFHTTPDPKPDPPHGEWDLQSSSFSACNLAFQVPQIAEEILLHDSQSCRCKLLIKY